MCKMTIDPDGLERVEHVEAGCPVRVAHVYWWRRMAACGAYVRQSKALGGA